ncbi:Hint domain-containing protein [Ruegeria sp.]|uniref:Hint domain-containing protein n=1 Tax=Ruegeria sp. TaxID=1879320 RepID=UPI003C7DB70D
MPINIYGAFRSDTTLSDNAATYATTGATFQISQYSQITITDGADGTIIDGDSAENEAPNDPTQTYLGEAIDWDFTLEVSDGVNTYQIGFMDWDENGDGDFDYPTAEQGYFLAFIGGNVPPLNTTLTIGNIISGGTSTNEPDIPVDTVVPCFTSGTQIATPGGLRAIETLSVGDEVLTLDHGTQRIRWIGARALGVAELIQNPKLRPIRIKAGALGCGLPRRDLLV